MENQENTFLGNADFGLQNASIISDETADLIFGGEITATAEDVKPIAKKNKDEKSEFIEPVEKEIKVDLSVDDILGEEKEDEDTEDNTTEVEEPTTDLTDKNNPITTMSKTLVELGIFTDNPDLSLPVTGEDLRDRWSTEKQTQMNQDMYNFLISKHGEKGVKTFQDIFVNGVNPEEYLTRNAQIENLRELDLEQESNQEKVLRESYRRQGLKSEVIEKKVQQAKDFGILEDDAKEFHEILLNQEEEELEQIAQVSAEKERSKVEAKRQYANNLNTILAAKLKDKDFDGIPVTDKVARETYDYLISEKWQLPNGEKLTDFDKDILELRDPKNHELRVKLALLLKNKLDLSKIKTIAISKEGNKLFGDLAIKEKIIKRKNTTVPSNSFLENLK